MSDLMQVLQKPKPEKKKYDWALWAAFLFWNAVAVIFDAIAALTAYRVTGNSLMYAVLAFCAGFIPLVIHEGAWYRPLANDEQKKIAIGGIVFSVFGILVVAIVSAFVNVDGAIGDIPATPALLVVIGVIVMVLVHGVLLAVYFHIDDGITQAREKASTREYHKNQREKLEHAQEILGEAEKVLAHQRQIEGRFGREELNEVLSQLGGKKSAPPVPARSQPALERSNHREPHEVPTFPQSQRNQ